MARLRGKLKHGLKLGQERVFEFEVHDHLTAGMILEAKEKAEKVVPFEIEGRVVPVVVESPARLGGLMLCQQVASLGPLAGPLDYPTLKTLHQEDLEILNLYADLAAGAVSLMALNARLDKLGATAGEVTDRGRDDRPGAQAGSDREEAAAPGHGNDRDPGFAKGAAEAADETQR